MKALDRYIVSEMVRPFLGSLGVCVVLLVGHTLWTIADVALENEVPAGVVMRFCLLRVPWALSLALPVSVLFASALAVSRLARDNEIFACGFSGVSTTRVLAPTLIVGLLASGLSFAVGELFVPWASTAGEDLARNMILGRKAFAVAVGRFIEAGPNSYAYALGVGADGSIEGLLVFQALPNSPPALLTAERAHLEGDLLVLERPTTYYARTDGGFVRGPGERAEIDVSRVVRQFWRGRPGLQEMGLGQLLREMESLRGRGIRGLARYELQAHWRLALPLACLVFAVLAGPMTLRFERGGSLVGLLVTVLCMFAYFIIMIWTEPIMAGLQAVLGAQSPWPPFIAAWWGTVLFAGVGGYLLATQR